jgi:hypothetical protein
MAAEGDGRGGGLGRMRGGETAGEGKSKLKRERKERWQGVLIPSSRGSAVASISSSDRWQEHCPRTCLLTGGGRPDELG